MKGHPYQGRFSVTEKSCYRLKGEKPGVLKYMLLGTEKKIGPDTIQFNRDIFLLIHNHVHL